MGRAAQVAKAVNKTKIRKTSKALKSPKIKKDKKQNQLVLKPQTNQNTKKKTGRPKKDDVRKVVFEDEDDRYKLPGLDIFFNQFPQKYLRKQMWNGKQPLSIQEVLKIIQAKNQQKLIPKVLQNIMLKFYDFCDPKQQILKQFFDYLIKNSSLWANI